MSVEHEQKIMVAFSTYDIIFCLERTLEAKIEFRLHDRLKKRV